MLYKYKGRKHHSVIPIIYTAGYAATVFHKKCLERTEEQNAYHIAYGIRKAYKYKNTGIDNLGVI